MPIRLTHIPTMGRALGMGDLAEIRPFPQSSLQHIVGVCVNRRGKQSLLSSTLIL